MDENKSTDETMSEGSDIPPEQESSTEGVHLTPEFQQDVHGLVSSANNKQLSYIQGCCSDRQMELMKSGNETDDKSEPTEYSDDDEPKD